jgi:hypothetical protein
MNNKEIDHLIAEKVMNYRVIPPSIHEPTGFKNAGYFVVKEETDDEDAVWVNQRDYCPSIDIYEAMLVVEKLHLTITPKWKVFFANASGMQRDTKWIGTTNNQEWVKHESLPMAICLAALKIKGINI